MTRLLVCDDRIEDLDNISKIIEDFYNGSSNSEAPAQYSLSRFSNPLDVISHMENNNTVDIAILDIMMPGMNGMELAAELREMGFGGYLIFLTTFNDFAAQSYSVKAFSYILKPAEQKMVWNLLKDIEDTRKGSDQSCFSLTRRHGARLVLFSDLIYVEVVNHTLYFHLIDGEVIDTYAALKEYSETLLRDPRMLKPQKSFIVNLDYVRSCENNAIFIRDGKRISIPKGFDAVRDTWLERRFGKGGW